MKKIEKLAIQLYTVRENLKEETRARETFKTLKELGFEQVQTAGCYGFAYDHFYEMVKDSGLEIIGTHDDFKMMREDIEHSIANHKMLHTSIMGIGGFWGKTEEEVKEMIQDVNKIADRIYREGMKFSYHNHSHEFIRFESGKSIMDMLIEGMDPEKTSICLDTHWVQNAGADPCKYIKMLAGRIDILHLKDMEMVRSADGTAVSRYTVPGMGNMNFEDIISTALDTGVKYFCVEHDGCPVDFEKTLEFTSEYLHKNFM